MAHGITSVPPADSYASNNYLTGGVAVAGRHLFASCLATNNTGIDCFLMFFDAAAVPANGVTTALATLKVLNGSWQTLDFGAQFPCKLGIAVAWSTDVKTFTQQDSLNSLITITYKARS